MKRISPGTVTIGVFAILFGLGVAYAARHYLKQVPMLAPPARPEMATIVVPRFNLPKYVRIRSDDVDTVQVPMEKLPEGAVQMKSRALFRLVKGTVMAGQPLMEADLYAVGEVPKLAEQLPPGYRAVTLQVNANSALNGMIQPESYVDISLTAEGSNPQMDGIATLTLLRRIQVLATSQNRFPRSEDRGSDDLRNITVAATSEQANKLILAQRYGTLSVTLRSSVDDSGLADAGDGDGRNLVNPDLLLGLDPIQPVPEPISHTAQIWRGGSMQEVSFQAGQIQESIIATAMAEGKDSAAAEALAASSSDASGSGKKKPCTNCEKKKKDKARMKQLTEGGKRPTLAPPKSQTRPVVAPGSKSGAARRVIEVPVKANQRSSGPKK